MRFPFRLLLKNLGKHKVRTALTVGSMVVALFLLVTLASLLTTMESGIKNAASDRLIVQSAVSLYVSLPENYLTKIRQVPGVKNVCSWNWFGGTYKEPENFFAQFACDHTTLLQMYPEIKILEGSAEAWAADRRSCLIGKTLVDDFGFELGQSIPIQGTIFPRASDEAWQFTVAGIYESTSPNVDQRTMFFRYDYMRETLEQKAADGPEGIGLVVVQIDRDRDPVAIMRGIDELFANGPQRTQTGTESEFQAQFVSMMGSVPFFLGSIGGAVFFAILLAVINTMLMAAREQTRDVGILKALGFRSATVFLLFFGQSIALALIGGGAGALLAWMARTPIAAMLATTFPNYHVLESTLLAAVVASLLVGVVAGLAPAILVTRQKTVDALRAEA